MKINLYYFALIAALVFSFTACNSNQKSGLSSKQVKKVAAKFARQVSPKNLVVGCQSDVFDASKGAQINYESGAKVIVPKNAFVDENGNPVTGEVKLEFSEINDPASIIASGLPMCIEENGKVGYMESGGMFEINAKQGDSKLRLAEGKNIEIQTMSNKPGDFNFYEYDGNNETWVEQNKQNLTATSGPNEQVSDSILGGSELLSMELSSTESAPVIKPIKAKSTDFIFDLKVDNMEKWGLKNWEGIMWKFANQSSNDKNESHWLFNRKWESIIIGAFDYNKSTCSITASYNERIVQTNKKTGKKKVSYKKVSKKEQITPVLFGNGYKLALEQYSKELNRKAKEQNRIAQRQKSYAASQSFLRSVRVQNLGVYNWDRIIKQPEMLVMNANYKVEGIYDHEDLPVVYMITGDKRELITFYQRAEGNLAFNPNYTNTLLAIMPNQELALIKTTNLPNGINSQARSGKTVTINLNPTGVFVNSTDELNDFIRNNS